MKYRIAKDNEYPTRMTHSQFTGITGCLSVDKSELLPRGEDIKEYGKIVDALLYGKIIIFAVEKEIPF